jgi:hypothetical protein
LQDHSTMIRRIGLPLIAFLLVQASSATATSIDSSLARSGSLSADIQRILDAPKTSGSDADPASPPTSPKDPSLDYYYSRLGARSAGNLLEDRYGAPTRQRGADDSSSSKKKPPKRGELSEPHTAWLLVAGALGLMALGRRRVLTRCAPDA